MRVTTSKSLEYDARWIDSPISDLNKLNLEIADDRLLSVIAAEFEGLERIERFSEQQGDKAFEGYTRLEQIARTAGGVMIFLAKA